MIFGIVVYLIISNLLLQQIDSTLSTTVEDIINNSSVSNVGELDVMTLPALELTAGVHIQYWDKTHTLKVSSPGIQNVTTPLDEKGFSYTKSVYNNVTFGTTSLRVFTVPLFIGDREVGTLMAGTSLNLVNSIRQSLILTLLTIALIAMLFVFVSTWFTVHRALEPLVLVTDVAQKISRADDLSRRIPEEFAQSDEVGSLIHTFNDTMARLEVLFNAQQRFLADVSHELRTPLTVIKGNADLIQKFGPDEESINTIKEEVDRLTRMVGDLLMLAQAESGKMSISIKQVQLDEVLLECFQEMRIVAGDKVMLKLLDIDHATILADKDRIKQVLINLISNAIKYTPQNGSIKVWLEKTNSYAIIRIEDNGPGIPKKDLENIFERFFRAERSRTRTKSGGYGLGLSIADRITKAHNGRIDVASVVGKGTTFSVYLPLVDNKP